MVLRLGVLNFSGDIRNLLMKKRTENNRRLVSIHAADTNWIDIIVVCDVMTRRSILAITTSVSWHTELLVIGPDVSISEVTKRIKIIRPIFVLVQVNF
jgi:hypothetical protein